MRDVTPRSVIFIIVPALAGPTVIPAPLTVIPAPLTVIPAKAGIQKCQIRKILSILYIDVKLNPIPTRYHLASH